jgi:hypothetical protein
MRRRRPMRSLLTTAAILVLFTPQAHAGEILQDSGGSCGWLQNPVGQSFTAIDVNLETIGFHYEDWNTHMGAALISVLLYSGEGVSRSLIDFRIRDLGGVNGMADFDFSGHTLVFGQVYSFEVQSSSQRGATCRSTANPYDGGMFYTGTSANSAHDMRFHVVGNLDGVLALVVTSAEPAGSNCASGGVRIDSGLDYDIDGTLDSGEINSTTYVCNGANGSSGLNTLVSTSAEAAGSNCTNGGIRIDTGVDDNDDGVLDAGEVDATFYVCDGAPGSDGADGDTSLMVTNTELAGGNCANGGVRVDSGIDVDANGTLSATEIDATTYVCDGTDGTDGTDGADGVGGADGVNGVSSLVEVSEIPAGDEACPNGGQRIESGLDADGDGTLSEGEILNIADVCSGDAESAGGGSSGGCNQAGHSSAPVAALPLLLLMLAFVRRRSS